MTIPSLLRRDVRCQQFVELVTDYLDGALPRRERTRFDRHLRRCDGCDRYLEQIRRTIALTGRLRVEDIDALGATARDRLLAAFRDFHTRR
jgi:anti-sigma factor RsiW